MTKILFVCHGNICRSPMAEFVMKDIAAKAGLSDEFLIESAATSTEEIGNPVYPPARRKLQEHGIACDGKTARQVRRADYDKFDLIIGMDEENMYNLRRLFHGDPEGKLSLLMDYTARPGSVADPWYTRDFEATWRDVLEGCTGFRQKRHAAPHSRKRAETQPKALSRPLETRHRKFSDILSNCGALIGAYTLE